MKKIIAIIGLLLLVIVTGVVIFLLTLDVNQYKPALMETVSEQTGREFGIEGDLEVVPSLTPSIAMSGITLGNADWAAGPNLLEVGRIEARVSLIPLFFGAVHINNFILHDTSIYLEKNTNGEGNWQLAVSQPDSVQPEGEATALPPVSIEDVEIRNVLVSYRDQAAESVIEFTLSEFTTSVTSLTTPVSFNLEAGYNDVGLSIAGSVGAVDDLTSGGEFPLDVAGELGELAFATVGSISNALEAPTGNLTITLDIDSLSDLNPLTGADLPDRGPVEFKGSLIISSVSALSLQEINLTLGDIGITGSVQLNTATAVPAIVARLQSDLLDLTPFMNKQEEEEAEYLFSRDVLPLEVLSSVNADISFNTSRLVLPSVELTDYQLLITLNDGNLELGNRAGLAGGELAASVDLRTVNSTQASLTASFGAEGIILEHLPHDEDRWFTGGETDISFNGTGSGGSVADIMGSFNGNILVTVGEASMPTSGIDLLGADILFSTLNRLNPLSSQQDYSLLECAVINLNINDGIIRLDRQIAVQTSKMYMVGSGEINLKNEQINLGVRPYAKEGVGLNLSSVAGAARIGGTLASPRAEVDAANAIKTGLSAGAAVATGGISLLAQGLFSRAGADPEPCNTALGAANQPASDTSTESVPEQGGGNVIDDVKDTFRGLFGR